MGAYLTVMQSRHIPDGDEIPPAVHDFLTVRNWTPPSSPVQGLFSCPKEEPMPLTRHEADVVVRRLVDRYYEATIPDGELTVDNTEPRFGNFRRKLAWQLGADIDRGELLEVLEAIDRLSKAEAKQDTEYAEADLNFTVNLLLDRTNIRGPHILRYTTQETHA